MLIVLIKGAFALKHETWCKSFLSQRSNCNRESHITNLQLIKVMQRSEIYSQ